MWPKLSCLAMAASILRHSLKSISTQWRIGPAATTWPTPVSRVFTQLPQVARLIKTEVDNANAELARVEQIKAFRILPKALDPEEEGEPVTPTRKVKRKLMAERFNDLVQDMYDDSEERLIAAGAGGILGN